MNVIGHAQFADLLAGPVDAEQAIEQLGGLLATWLRDGLVCGPRA